MTKYAMAIDLDRCIGCRTCGVICKDYNSQPSGIWWNRVFAEGAPEYSTSVVVDGAPRMEFLPISCQHCENAPCQTVCPTGATYTDEDGAVLVDYERCIGCRYCITACPYEVRQFNWSAPKTPVVGWDGAYGYGYPDEYRQNGHLVYAPVRPEGVVEKCTFCAQRTAVGEKPACCISCPADARIFGDIEDPDSDVSTYLQKAADGGREPYVIGASHGTNPKVYYLASKHNGADGSKAYGADDASDSKKEG